MKQHPTMKVRNEEHGFEVEIDAGIAPLIKELWIAGVKTINCSQEAQPGWMAIEFLTTMDATRFLDIVAGDFDTEHDSLYNRIRREWIPSDGREIAFWHYSLAVWDVSVYEEESADGTTQETAQGQRDFEFYTTIRFPISDFDVVYDHTLTYNADQKAHGQTR